MKNKKSVLSLIFIVLLSINLVTAANDESNPCSLSASLISQDPNPAVPGEDVEVLFQISGVTDRCNNGAAADLVIEYPFTLIEGSSYRTISSNTFAEKNYNWNVLYKLRVDPSALNKDYELELKLKEGSDLNWDGSVSRKFNISVEEVTTDFEIHIQNYKIFDKTFTLEVLNTGDQDIEALTVEIPKQDNIMVKGSNRNIVGDLDSNEYTTADFEAVPKEGNIIVYLYYTDSINERRMIEKIVYYDPNYFIGSKDNTKPNQTGTYITVGIIILLLVFFLIRRHRHKKKMKGKREFQL